jgi:hypothetical protein
MEHQINAVSKLQVHPPELNDLSHNIGKSSRVVFMSPKLGDQLVNFLRHQHQLFGIVMDHFN